jgi:putative tryptophan/tyrosine transport system substrate-binding protein
MRRREIIAGIGAATCFSLPVGAQQPAMPVVGFLTASQPVPLFVAAFRQGLSQFGFVEGRNVTIDYRSAEGQPDRFRALAEDLVQHRVAVIVTPDGVLAPAAKAASSTIPIVFATGVDPVATGLVASLAQPGGNVTGVYVLAVGLIAKRLELLHQLVPAVKSIGLLLPFRSTPPGPMETEGQTAARGLGLKLVILTARSRDEIEAAFAGLAPERVGALLVAPYPLFRTEKDKIVTLAARHAIPAGYENSLFTTAGGLMSYGPDDGDIARQIGVYTGRILRGAQPSDLAVVQPTKFEFVINLKTAKTLGLAVPPNLLALADELLE